jgi:hypothetical protein
LLPCGKTRNYIIKCLYARDDDREENKKGNKKMGKRKLFYMKKGGEAHIGKEWDSDKSSSSDSDNENVSTLSVTPGFPFSYYDVVLVVFKGARAVSRVPLRKDLFYG